MTDTPLTPEERDRALDEIVRRVRRYGLETPTIFFLEMNRPLASLAGLASFAVTPLFGAFLGLDNVERYASLIGDREALDELIDRLEKSADARKSSPSPGVTPGGTSGGTSGATLGGTPSATPPATGTET